MCTWLFNCSNTIIKKAVFWPIYLPFHFSRKATNFIFKVLFMNSLFYSIDVYLCSHTSESWDQVEWLSQFSYFLNDFGWVSLLYFYVHFRISLQFLQKYSLIITGCTACVDRFGENWCLKKSESSNSQTLLSLNFWRIYLTSLSKDL